MRVHQVGNMCGILGSFGSFSPSLISRALASAPDCGSHEHVSFGDAAEGLRLGYAHRNTEGRHAPIWSSNGRLALFFVGEITNRRQLAAELETGSASREGSAAAELLLELYQRAGQTIWPKIQGDFAFAIWDYEVREVLLTCDVSSVRAFYVAEAPNGVLFADDIATLLRLVRLERALSSGKGGGDELDDAALRRGIIRVLPGCAMRLKKGRVIDHRPWH